MKIKVDTAGHVVLGENGFPVWLSDEGKEIEYDVPRLVSDMQRVNAESAGRRKEIDALNEKLKAFDGIEPEKARIAMEKAANIDDGKLIELGKVEELKKQVASSYESKISEIEKVRTLEREERDNKLKSKDARINNLLVRSVFDQSKHLAEKTVLPPDMAFAAFGTNFAVVEDGDSYKVVGKLNGQDIFSTARPGQLADPEECIAAMIDAYPMKDRIMRAPEGGSGSYSGTKMNQDTTKMSSVERIAKGLRDKGMV